MSGDHDHPELDDLERRLDEELDRSPLTSEVHELVRELAAGIRLLVNRVVMGEGPLGVNDSELIAYLSRLDALDQVVAEA